MGPRGMRRLMECARYTSLVILTTRGHLRAPHICQRADFMKAAKPGIEAPSMMLSSKAHFGCYRSKQVRRQMPKKKKVAGFDRISRGVSDWITDNRRNKP